MQRKGRGKRYTMVDCVVEKVGRRQDDLFVGGTFVFAVENHFAAFGINGMVGGSLIGS